MKQLARIVALLALLVAPAAAQTTSGGQIAFSVQVFNNASGPGTGSAIPNANQSSHWLFYTTSNTTAISIYLQGSFDNVNFVTISPIGVALSSGIVQASGYYPYVQAIIGSSSCSGSCIINAWYSGSTGPVNLPANTGLGTTSQPVSAYPITITNGYVGATTPSSAIVGGAVGLVLYGANIYNPNSGLVYVFFSCNSSALPTQTPVLIAIPGTSDREFTLPSSGWYCGSGAMYVTASTSATSNTAPGAAVIVAPLVKATYNAAGVPN
jgi:hypothetical protein